MSGMQVGHTCLGLVRDPGSGGTVQQLNIEPLNFGRQAMARLVTVQKLNGSGLRSLSCAYCIRVQADVEKGSNHANSTGVRAFKVRRQEKHVKAALSEMHLKPGDLC